ncbi:macrolide ABC transporter ATP-binding protein [archaeon CG_4_10_14_0_2_um_filter_Archaea_38_6]|nr:MAG: macrolide ABC transporter ATP-binding protein [archaeon CG_4_10_14_0_2_um_filter_Archaea_38_6]
MEGKTIVQMEDVKRFYKMGEETIKALNGINIIIEEGELIAIFGPSGSGKSTLMHIIGLLDTHIQGRIKINNIDSKDLSKREITHLRSNNIGFIFQSFFLTPNLTALENVELPMMLVDENEAFRKKRAEELLRMVGLEKRMNHLPKQLSGGQRQRVAIARALANNPKLILADEPTGNLDSKTGKEIIRLFKELWKKGTTFVIVTHDPKLARQAPRVIKILDGKVISDGKYKHKNIDEFVG